MISYFGIEIATKTGLQQEVNVVRIGAKAIEIDNVRVVYVTLDDYLSD